MQVTLNLIHSKQGDKGLLFLNGKDVERIDLDNNIYLKYMCNG